MEETTEKEWRIEETYRKRVMDRRDYIEKEWWIEETIDKKSGGWKRLQKKSGG